MEMKNIWIVLKLIYNMNLMEYYWNLNFQYYKILLLKLN